MDTVLETRWKEATCVRTRKKCAEMGMWIICGFCSGLRGEEMMLIEFADIPHFCFVVSRRTKSNRASGAKFELSIATFTPGICLHPGKWIQRLVKCIRSKGRTTGRLFQRKLDPPLPFEFQDDFYWCWNLYKLQPIEFQPRRISEKRQEF
mmetsp:Transcript_22941/g.34799  ORF Transcript_22941/g.34799 Transcript_22941/m.34799 type:complete len:150 (-) Transcript_22941:555-1004(-)